jgi:hypothetical protein
MSDIPSTVQIGAVTYAVTIDPDAWMRYEHENQSKGEYGYTLHTEAIILLNPESAPDVARQTLWHEIMHGLCETTMGSPNWRGLGAEKSDREEAVVRAFESPTLLVLRDNPDLVAYLTWKATP